MAFIMSLRPGVRGNNGRRLSKQTPGSHSGAAHAPPWGSVPCRPAQCISPYTQAMPRPIVHGGRHRRNVAFPQASTDRHVCDIVCDAMHEWHGERRVLVFDNDYHALCPNRQVMPFQRRRQVCAKLGIFLWNAVIFEKGRAGNNQSVRPINQASIIYRKTLCPCANVPQQPSHHGRISRCHPIQVRRSVCRSLGVNMEHDHARDNERDTDERCHIKRLTVKYPTRQDNQGNTDTGPDCVGHAKRNSAQGKRKKVER